jgi:hypothetical protein
VRVSRLPSVHHAARRLSWKETAEAFRTSRDKVFDAVEHVVTFGLEHRVPGQTHAIGVDEIQDAKCHEYVTLVYQIALNVTRLLSMRRDRTIESFRGFFTVNKAKVTMRKSCGFRTFRCLELALNHSPGKLPKPESTHEFF